MDLRLDADLARAYKSPAQIARVVTEDWARREMFCMACNADHVAPERAGAKVIDYHCSKCAVRYQLKAKAGWFSAKVTNSAYEPKIQAIQTGRAPAYGFLSYDRSAWLVTNFFVVPGHFLSPGVIEKRKPLSSSARRAGWIGSNILLGRLPSEARIAVVEAGKPRAPSAVRSDWRRFAFLRAGRGWTADILRCVRELARDSGRADFALSDFTARYSRELSRLYPSNRHVAPKIRQQLQILRDRRVLAFERRGRYRVVG